MKNKIYGCLFFLLVTLSTYAQEKDFSISPFVGVTMPILDNGVGAYAGINTSYSITSRFAIEGQVSYLNTKVNSSFLSGNEGVINSANALVGGRVYLSPQEKKTRFYLNALVGGNYSKESVNSIEGDTEFTLGFSGGGFVQIKNFIVGLSYETPQNIVLKAGYNFPL